MLNMFIPFFADWMTLKKSILFGINEYQFLFE